MAGTPQFYPASPVTIRNATFDRVSTVAGLANVYKARTMPGQDDQFPYACVWYQGERTQPWGDANVAAPAFEHTLTLVIDVLTRAGDETSLDTAIVDFVETIRATLLTDPTWLELSESVGRIDTRYAYPKDAADMACQAIIEIELTFRSEWPPVVPNALATVAVAPQPAGALNGFSTRFDNLDA